MVIVREPWLSHVIPTIWQASGNPTYRTETIVPSGIVEVIFNLSEGSVLEAKIGGHLLQLPKCFITGYNTQPILLNMPVHQSFFGVRFYPTAIRHVFGEQAGAFANWPVDLSLVYPSIASLWHQLASTAHFDQRVACFKTWLNNRPLGLDARDRLLNNFLYMENATNISASSLAKNLCFSSRQLSRRFHGLTGMNTEEILLYKKYLHSVRLIHGTQSSLTEVAFACHFYDQSHFTKTFKSFTHLTPGTYKKLKGLLPAHIYQ